MPREYIRYTPAVETLVENEQQIIDDVIASMTRLDGRTKEQYGKHVRVSYAKSHGLAVCELTVLPGLPQHLAQGLFDKPGTYPVTVRLANVPGRSCLMRSIHSGDLLLRYWVWKVKRSPSTRVKRHKTSY